MDGASISVEQKSGYQYLVIRGAKALPEAAEPQPAGWSASRETISLKESTSGVLLTTTFGGRLFLREPG